MFWVWWAEGMQQEAVTVAGAESWALLQGALGGLSTQKPNVPACAGGTLPSEMWRWRRELYSLQGEGESKGAGYRWAGAVPGSRGAPMMDNRDSLRYLMGHHEPLTLLVHVQALAFKSCQPPAFPETQQGHSSPCRGTAFFPVLHLSSLAHLCKRQELHLPLLHCYIYLHIFVVPLLFTFIFNVNLIIFIVLHLISLWTLPEHTLIL